MLQLHLLAAAPQRLEAESLSRPSPVAAAPHAALLSLLCCQVGSAYLTLGLKPKDRVGVFGANCPEWMLAMQGCNRTR